MIQRLAVVAYGAIAYLVFLVVFVATIAFLADVSLPRGIDQGPVRGLGVAITVNTVLLAAFAAQHTVMARPAFKRWLQRRLPAAIERSTFVLAASLVLAAVVWGWQAMPVTVWSVETPWVRTLLWGLHLLGWVVVVASTFMIDHFDLFGLRQVAARVRDRDHVPPSFRTTLLYRFVRHPIMVGFLIAFWVTPQMSQGRLLFAVLATAYTLVGVRIEERDLRAELGEVYDDYAATVGRFVPRWRPATQRMR